MTVNQSDTTNDVDCTTLYRKLMMGYQGWFSCPADGSQIPSGRWWHWFGEEGGPDALNLTVDMWPDTSELGSGELSPTNMTSPNGRAALYSAYNPVVVDLHFKWMKEYDLDGIMLQRFVCEVGDQKSPFKVFRDQVAKNVLASAEVHRRVFCIMYDITGSDESTFVEVLEKDWADLVDQGITDSKWYLKHKEKPILGIWGLGFGNNVQPTPGTPAQAKEIIANFKNEATLLGGVPAYWRTPLAVNSDAKTEPDWADLYTSFNVLSPWTVGRFANQNGADNFMVNQMIGDLEELSHHDIDYMPVIFPGYSYRNSSRVLQHEGCPLDSIPRNGGNFWWHQVYNAINMFKTINAGHPMIYGAMFDEVNEGTAMFKLAANIADLPIEAQKALVYLNINGGTLAKDWYLRLAKQSGKMLRGEIGLTPTIPSDT